MATALSPEVLQDDMAVSLARVLAVANKRARDAGVDILQSFITISQNLKGGKVLWRVNYGPRNYIGRRGGDLIVEVDPVDATVVEVLLGQ